MRKRDPNRIEMGRRFREAREGRNWSRETLAERSDLSVSFIADLELGNTGTRLENLVRLCRLHKSGEIPTARAHPHTFSIFSSHQAAKKLAKSIKG